jgi:dTDP-4-dehydrorhamnose 3,5-epimerase
MSVASEDLAIPGVKVVRPRKHQDGRGFFSETYVRRDLAELGIDVEFVQDNHSLSHSRGTVRGMHFQTLPMAQAKLVRVVRGVIFDVAVDIRAGSPTFGRHVSATISANDWNQIFIPVGFAHGFMTLEPDTEVLYKTSAYYSPQHEKGIVWNDPALGIRWPLPDEHVTVSDRDRAHPPLAKLPKHFEFAAEKAR